MSFVNTKKGTVSLFILVFALMTAIGVLLGGQLNNLFLESVATKDVAGKPIDILFMGIDARDTNSNSRSDTMIVVSIDPVSKKVAMVSIPRDTRIKNAAGKYDKINSINLVQGPEAACKEVSKLLNSKVDYYVLTNFAGFGDIVDTLGGVDINVETAMYHDDPVNPELAINLPKGYQHLNGKQALAFVRYRGMATADIGRTEDQQKFVKALATQMMQSRTILKIPELIPELSKSVRTNLPIKDMIYLANMAPKLDLAHINTQTLPGYFLHDDITGASYWEADKKIAGIILNSMLQGQNFKVVSESPASIQPTQAKPIIPVMARNEETENKGEEHKTLPGSENTTDKTGTTPAPIGQDITIDSGGNTKDGTNGNTDPSQTTPGNKTDQTTGNKTDQTTGNKTDQNSNSIPANNPTPPDTKPVPDTPKVQ